jgi:hypothetical protein
MFAFDLRILFGPSSHESHEIKVCGFFEGSVSKSINEALRKAAPPYIVDEGFSCDLVVAARRKQNVRLHEPIPKALRESRPSRTDTDELAVEIGRDRDSRLEISAILDDRRQILVMQLIPRDASRVARIEDRSLELMVGLWLLNEHRHTNHVISLGKRDLLKQAVYDVVRDTRYSSRLFDDVFVVGANSLYLSIRAVTTIRRCNTTAMPGVKDDDGVVATGTNVGIIDQMSFECVKDVGARGISVGYEFDMRFWDMEGLFQKILEVFGVIDAALQVSERFVLKSHVS